MTTDPYARSQASVVEGRMLPWARLLVLPLALLVSPGCQVPETSPYDGDRSPAAEDTIVSPYDRDAYRGNPPEGPLEIRTLAGSGPPTHGAVSRERGRQLDAIITQLLGYTIPELKALRHDLARTIASMPAPDKLNSNEPGLREWRSELRDAYLSRVDGYYDVARDRVRQLRELAYDTAVAQARRLSLEPAPLDAGPTGDPTLDTRLLAMDEVLAGHANLGDLDASRQQSKLRESELLQVFSSFATTDAEEALGGRLLLFIGGEDQVRQPRAVLAYRHDGEASPGDFFVAQVVRRRVMRGPTVIYDYIWRPAPAEVPGYPRIEVFGDYLIVPDIEPRIYENARLFHELQDTTTMIDVQTAVFDADENLLGGVDWRMEARVSSRLDLTWEISSLSPIFDPYCSEVQRELSSR